MTTTGSTNLGGEGSAAVCGKCGALLPTSPVRWVVNGHVEFDYNPTVKHAAWHAAHDDAMPTGKDPA